MNVSVYFWKVNDNFVIDLKFSGKYGDVINKCQVRTKFSKT